MAWAKMKPAFILGSFVRGFFHGSRDEVMCSFSDSEIARLKDIADSLDRCKPWKNHLKRDAVNEINKALKQPKDKLYKARSAIVEQATEDANPHCINSLKLPIIEVCEKCSCFIREALPEGIEIPD